MYWKVPSLVQSAATQVVCDDDVSDCVEHKLYVLRVGGARHVAVDLLRGRLVLGLELCLDVGSCLTVLLSSCILRETDCQRRSQNFLFKQILLVEEEDDGGVPEPLVVADGVKQLQTLLHSVRSLILVKNLVVLGHGDTEDDGRHVLETMDPLLTL